ncbi:IclR family transcriptional regulator [Arthrobacter sp. EH-1B-1]|uniref:IclR family transcriptional regulator n=1 Tax=Arthrobacter vasquezii TaxID=2977629 RepID=A0ABT6CUA7_9MICC|nr:IclR family transcriptional regulator [Arthrobacter vasquezii]MDF9277613.1 IclR family transcriptional regulator [Arthrobacter vasquezii]
MGCRSSYSCRIRHDHQIRAPLNFAPSPRAEAPTSVWRLIAASQAAPPNHHHAHGRPQPDERKGVIDRAASVLFSFSVRRPRMTLGEIAQTAALPPSTVRRLLVQLSEGGLIQQDPQSGHYSLSLRFVQLGAVALETVDIVRLSQPILQELSFETKEAAFLGQLEPQGVVYLSVCQPSVPIRVSTRAGEVRPAHVTSIGKKLLAFLPEHEFHEWLESHPLEATTGHALTTPGELIADLEQIRERGYGINYQESSMEFASVAAPVRDHNRDVIAAVAVSGPVYRIDQTDIPGLGSAAVEAAKQLSARLGNVAATA